MLRHWKQLFLLGSILLSTYAQAEKKERIAGVDVVFGLPQMLGVGVAYMGNPNFEAGLSFGSIPVNRLLNNSAQLAKQPLNLGTPDSYSLIPSASFSTTSLSPFVRYFPFAGDLYLQAMYSLVRVGASVNGDLSNDTQGTITPGVVNGTLNLSQSMVTASVGYRPFITDVLFAHFNLGVTIVAASGYELGVGGTLSDLVNATPQGKQEFENAKADLKDKVDSALRQYREKVKFLPSFTIALGFAF